MTRFPFLLLGIPFAVACGGNAPAPLNPAPVADAGAVVSAPPDAAAPARALVPLREPTTRRIATWSLNEVPPDDTRGDLIATASFSDVLIPRDPVLAHQHDFAVELGAALDRIDALAQRAITDAEPAMVADLAARTNRAPKGSTIRGREDKSVLHVQLARDHGALTVSVWLTLRQRIDGPLVKAPPAKCAPGQPCAQQADQRSDASVTETFGARYVVKSDGSLEELLYLPQGSGP